MEQSLEQVIQSVFDHVIEYRRDFHKYPEVGWTEFRTASKIARRLSELGYAVELGKSVIRKESRMGLPSELELEAHYERALEQGADTAFLDDLKGGYTGVVGTLKFGEGPVVALRFDIDALKVNECKEDNHFPAKAGFLSINEGVMHSCGHDTHAAIGLGVAEAIVKLGDKHFSAGTLKLVFQPAEEGVRGAKSMVDAGVLDDVDYVISGHMMAMKSGVLVCGAGGFMATTKLDVTYKGLSAHAGAGPQEGKNSMLAACSAVLNLNAIPRHAEGASRVNVGLLQAGSDRNVIAEDSFMKLEIRGETNAINQYVEAYALRIIKSAAQMHDVRFEIQQMGAAPSGKPTQELVSRIQRVSEKLGVFDDIQEWSDDATGSEDFMYMMNHVQDQGGQGAYFIVGSDKVTGHHTSNFDIQEADVIKAVHLYVGLVDDLLA